MKKLEKNRKEAMFLDMKKRKKLEKLEKKIFFLDMKKLKYI